MQRLCSAVTVLLMLASIKAFATRPFAEKTVSTSDGKLIIKLKSGRGIEKTLIIENSKEEAIASFSEDELFPLSENSPRPYQRWTTAGSDWYQNSIILVDKADKYFVVYLRWGKFLVMDLHKKRLLTKVPDDLKREINETATVKATAFLLSDNAKDRQTGALFCGILKVRKAIPQLRKLLRDNEFYSTRSGDGPWKNVYYVRKEAKEALEKMNEKVEGVVFEVITGDYKPNRK